MAKLSESTVSDGVLEERLNYWKSMQSLRFSQFRTDNGRHPHVRLPKNEAELGGRYIKVESGSVDADIDYQEAAAAKSNIEEANRVLHEAMQAAAEDPSQHRKVEQALDLYEDVAATTLSSTMRREAAELRLKIRTTIAPQRKAA